MPVNNIAVKSQIKWTCDAHWKTIGKEEERQFDEKGNLVKWVQYTSDASICDEFRYEYEGKKIVKEYRKECSQNDDRASVKIYTYGLYDRIEEENTLENKKCTKTSKFKFRTANAKYAYLREDFFDGDSEPTTIANLTYDKNGNLLVEEQLVSGSWFGTYTYKFDNRGDLIYQTGSVDGGVGLVEYFYIYDKGILVKDSVKIPDNPTEYHIYEIKKIN